MIIRNSQLPSQRYSVPGYIHHSHVKPCSTCQSKVTKNSPPPPLRQKSNNNTVNETTVFTLFDTVKIALTDCYHAISCFIKTMPGLFRFPSGKNSIVWNVEFYCLTLLLPTAYCHEWIVYNSVCNNAIIRPYFSKVFFINKVSLYVDRGGETRNHCTWLIHLCQS